MSLAYYLGKIGAEEHSSLQAKVLRSIILSEKPELMRITEFRDFVLLQPLLSADAIWLINKALMPAYGAEYLGFAGDDYDTKLKLFMQFVHQFSDVALLKCYAAECALLACEPIEIIWPLLNAGMLADAKNIYYPTSEMFEFLQESQFAFVFDMLLLDKYYQPCRKGSFDDWIEVFRNKYTTKEQQDFMCHLRWKGL